MTTAIGAASAGAQQESAQAKGGPAATGTFAAVLDAVSKGAKQAGPRGHHDKAKGTGPKEPRANGPVQSLVALAESVVAAHVPVAHGNGPSGPPGAPSTATQASQPVPYSTHSQGPHGQEPPGRATRPTPSNLAQEGPAQPAHEGSGATAPTLSAPTGTAGQATTKDGRDPALQLIASNETPAAATSGDHQVSPGAGTGTATAPSPRGISRGPVDPNPGTGTASAPSPRGISRVAPHAVQPAGGQADGAGSPAASGGPTGKTAHGAPSGSAARTPLTASGGAPLSPSPHNLASEGAHLAEAGGQPQGTRGEVPSRAGTIAPAGRTVLPDKPMPGKVGTPTAQAEVSQRGHQAGAGAAQPQADRVAAAPSRDVLVAEQAPTRTERAGSSSPSPSSRTSQARAPLASSATAGTPTKTVSDQSPAAAANALSAHEIARSRAVPTGQQPKAAMPGQQLTATAANPGPASASAMPPPGTLSQQAAPVALHVGQQVSAAVSQHLDQLPQPSRGTDGTWTLSVQLDPPELGKVDAVLSLGASGLSVVLAPSTPAAQQAIQQASRQIAQNIGGNVTVFVQTGAGGTGGGQQGHPGAGGQRPATWLGGEKGRTGDVARERTQGPTYMLV